MAESALVDVFREALRVLFILCAPLLFGGMLAAVLAGILMFLTSLQDAVFSYCFRLLACVIVIGVMSNSFLYALQQLLRSALE